MAAYKDRVAEDLERWIAAGLVPAESRNAILASLPESRRLDAAAALAWVGAVLLGIAVIAFIAANWDGMSRFTRFALLLAGFTGAAGAAAWASRAERPGVANALLTLAALVFAAAIGLTGQIFDIAGSESTALRGAGLVAALLALAGGASGPAVAALALIGLGDFTLRDWFVRDTLGAPWLIVAGPAGAALALRWKSAALAHAGAIAVIASFVWIVGRFEHNAPIALFLSVWLAALAAGGRWLQQQGRGFGGVFYGWFAWAGLGLFALAGYVDGDWGIVHRLAWLIAAGGLIALGRHDRHAAVTAAGIVGLLSAVAALFVDLGLDLMTAAALFLVAALVALVVGFALRRRQDVRP